MKILPLPLALILSAASLAVLGGCSTSSEQGEARAPVEARELNRSGAIASARHDAASKYGDAWIAQVNAHYLGGYWMVELRSMNGAGLRYAISARDGQIRERSTIQ